MNKPSSIPRLTGLRRKPGLPELEALLEALPGAALLLDDAQRSILLANGKAVELTAYTRSELTGMRLTALFPTLDELAFWGGQDNKPVSFESALLRRNRNRLAVEAHRNAFGRDSRWSLLTLERAQDVKKSKDERQRRHNLMQSMQNLTQALIQPQLEKALDLVLKAALDITGASLASIYLQQYHNNPADPEVARFVHTGPPEPLPASMAINDMTALRSPHYWSSGKRPSSLLHRAARLAGLQFVASAPIGTTQAMLGLIVVAGMETVPSDILIPNLKLLSETASSLIEIYSRTESLKESLESEQRAASLNKLVEDTINAGIVLLAPDLRILRINAAAERMFGYSQREAGGRPMDHILIGQGGLEASLQLALEGHPTLQNENLHFYRRSGQPFRARVSLLPSHSGESLEGIVFLIEDLSEQEQVELQAQQLEQRAMLGEVISIFAHEVRNPINNISTGLQVMALNLGPDHPNQEMIGRLQHDCDRVDELMKSVLAYSRPTEYEMQAVDIGGLLTRLIDRQRPRMARAGLESKIQIEPGAPVVAGNPRALEQVFTNLVTNAIQAMTETGGTLAVRIQTVSGSAERRFVRVEVADSGPGIPKELQDRLFQPFFTTKTDGTGLGLAITKRIVTAHKGSIQVTSFLGGTVFQVLLPAMELE